MQEKNGPNLFIKADYWVSRSVICFYCHHNLSWSCCNSICFGEPVMDLPPPRQWVEVMGWFNHSLCVYLWNQTQEPTPGGNWYHEKTLLYIYMLVIVLNEKQTRGLFYTSFIYNVISKFWQRREAHRLVLAGQMLNEIHQPRHGFFSAWHFLYHCHIKYVHVCLYKSKYKTWQMEGYLLRL